MWRKKLSKVELVATPPQKFFWGGSKAPQNCHEIFGNQFYDKHLKDKNAKFGPYIKAKSAKMIDFIDFGKIFVPAKWTCFRQNRKFLACI